MLVLTSRFAVAAAAPATTVEPDFTLYQQLLDQWLHRTSADGAPLETRFDYEEFYVLPNRDAVLQDITKQLLAVPPSSMKESSRLAWAINTYNFLVLRTATQNLYERRITRGKVDGRRAFVRRGYGSVVQMEVNGGRFFDAPVVQVEGKDYSLTSFERHFLFADFDPRSGQPRPKALDPRVRLVIIPGTRSSPALRPRAFTGESLAIQLDQAVREALANPRHLRWNEQTGQIEANSVFSTYAAEFGGPAGEIAFLKKYAPEDIRREIEARRIQTVDGVIPWDGNLNQLPADRRPRIIDG
jgi:hypothetical protein